MTDQKRKMALTALLNGAPNTWRHPQGQAYGNMDLQQMIHNAQIAERGKFHSTFLADFSGVKDDGVGLRGMRKSGSCVGFEPATLLAAIAMATSDIGLVATISTTYSEPFSVARLIGSLDHISGGRGGWNLITSGSRAEAQNFGHGEQLSSAERYARAREHVEIVTRLWDSWDDDAFPRDRQSGMFFDPDKGRNIDFHGTHFSVRGPLNMPRPPQGQPVICQAGTSDAGYEMAAQWADLMYVKAPTIEIGKAFYADVKARARKYGRAPQELAVLPGLSVVLGGSEEEARANFSEIVASLEAEEGLGYLSQWLDGYDLTGLPLDAPVPDIPEINIPAERNRIFLVRNGQRLTLREAMQYVATMVGHLTMFGTPDQIATQMIRWVEEEACDGFNLMPHILPGAVEDFVDHIVPELQKRGAYHQDYEGHTLRENLGLAHRPSQYQVAALQAS